MNLLYAIPKLNKVSGGPRTRITSFIKTFIQKGNVVIEGKNKLLKSIKTPKLNIVYVESATNRIGLVDFISLLILKFKSKSIVIFIRDVYIEIFPEEYSTFRKTITRYANLISNYILVIFADRLAFPTIKMGEFFFNKHKNYIKKPFFALPPAINSVQDKLNIPDFSKKVGILYLGGIAYKFSGFENFLDFARQYQDIYNFYVLSGDKNIEQYKENKFLTITKIPHQEIPKFISDNNIAYAFHSRPRNLYDDMTYPIKIMDFLSFGLPFVSDRHIPLVSLMGKNYPFFTDITNFVEIHNLMQKYLKYETYKKLVDQMHHIAKNNIYEERYKKIINQR